MKSLILAFRYTQTAVYNPNKIKRDYIYSFPIGLSYISAVLKKSGQTVQCLNLNHCDGLIEDIIKEKLSNENFDFIITGGLSPHYPDIKHCVEIIRKYAPRTKIILGGGIISAQPEIMFNLLRPDYAVIGEGELTVKELIECIEKNDDINCVDGLIYRDSSTNLVFTKPREYIKDVDTIPWPDYESLGFEEQLDHTKSSDVLYNIVDYPRIYPLLASRSCPFSCTFCYHPLGNKYRQRSVDNIIQELAYVIPRFKINIIFFYDELFAPNKARIDEFCKKLKDLLKEIPWDVKWNCGMRVDSITEEMIKTMKEAGCYHIGFGLESMSQKVLDSMKKRITPEQIDNALRITARNGIIGGGMFIFGDTAETVETATKTLTYWKNNEGILGVIGLGFIILYQGTENYKQAVKRGIIKDEIAFIEDRVINNRGFKPINFTENMTDAEYKMLIYDVTSVYFTLKYYSLPIKNIQKNGVNEVHTKCPHCKQISVNKNYYLPQNFYYASIYCKKCGHVYSLFSQKYRLVSIIFQVIGAKNLYNMNPVIKKVLKRIFNV